MKSKKVLIAVLALVLIICCVFAACKSGETEEVQPPVGDEEITLDTAVIKNADSIALIKSYDPSELGLEGSWEDYDWVAHKSEGVYIDNGKYKGYFVRVEVGNKNYNEDGTFDVTTAGIYYISYDGETLLHYYPENDTYEKIKNVHDIPEVTLAGESTTAADTTTEAAE